MKTLREYIDILESIRSSGENDLIGYIDDEGRLVTVGYRPGFAKSIGHSDGGWIEGTDRAIPDSWKPVYFDKQDVTQDLEETPEDPIKRIDRLFQDK